MKSDEAEQRGGEALIDTVPTKPSHGDSNHKRAESRIKIAYWVIYGKCRRFKIWLLNPSRLLRWMLFALFVLYIGLVALGKGYLDHFTWAIVLKKQLLPVDWVTSTGIYFAVSGWIVSAIVTMRNSVKQHSINTLLQSRLSKTYMDEAVNARGALAGYDPEHPVPAGHIENHENHYSIDYILNYIEFMAVGIKHGDLHEDVMKDSMRGIVLRFTAITMPYIEDSRLKVGPRTFENLLWLRKRWGGKPVARADNVNKLT